MVAKATCRKAVFDRARNVLAWRYDDAFQRNLGLISRSEQRKIRDSRVAIAGVGGVGGVHLITLARLGVGAFRIADPDAFDVANFNRQYGAEVRSIGKGKAVAMAEKALAVNPHLDLDVVSDPIHEENVDAFLDNVDLVVDGIDFFACDARRTLFRAARKRGIWTVTAGPIGFSTAWLAFDPNGMSFDEYFDFDDSMAPIDQFAAFAVGLAPRATHLPYIDLSEVSAAEARGPSLGLACHLASGVVAAEAAKILLGRGAVRAAPCFAQFDAYRCLLRRGKLRWGNRGPVQRLKRALLRRHMRSIGFEAGIGPAPATPCAVNA